MQNLRSYLLAYIKVVQKLKFIVEWVLPSNWKCDDFSRSMNSREGLHNENSAFPYMTLHYITYITDELKEPGSKRVCLYGKTANS